MRDVHPVADLFPMLADDELAELAEDIKQRGLLQPIVLDTAGRVLDGRNRLAACEMVGVEPTFTKYDGDDPNGYALAVNIARRHLTTGARAILAAQAARLNGHGSATKIAKVTDLLEQRISDAGVVLDYAAHLVPGILTGTQALSTALVEAREHKKIADATRAKQGRLRTADAGLMSIVAEGRMDLDEAIAALDAREDKARRDEQERRSTAERERAQRERDEEDALSRHRARIEGVVSGWPTVREYLLGKPDDPRTEAIVSGLGETTKKALQDILHEIGA